MSRASGEASGYIVLRGTCWLPCKLSTMVAAKGLCTLATSCGVGCPAAMHVLRRKGLQLASLLNLCRSAAENTPSAAMGGNGRHS